MWSLSADPRLRPGPSDRAIGSKGLAEIPYNVIVGHLRGLPSLAFTSADMNLRLPPIKKHLISQITYLQA